MTGTVFLYAQDIVLVVVGEVVARGVELAVFQNDKQLVLPLELAEQFAAAVGVEAEHVGVEPDFQSAECRNSFLFQREAVNLVFRHEIAHRPFPFDGEGAEVDVELKFGQTWTRFQGDADNLGLAVMVGREPGYARARKSGSQVIFVVTLDAGNREPLHVEGSAAAVLIDDIVDRACVVALEYTDMEHVLAYEQLFLDFHNLVAAVAVDDDDIVEARATAYRVIFLQTGADESFVAVEIELFVGLGHGGGGNGVEAAYDRVAREGGSVALLQVLEP